MGNYIAVKRAADILGVHEKTVRRMIKRDELKAYRIGRMLRVQEDDLKAYMDGNLVVPSRMVEVEEREYLPGERLV